MKFLKYILYMDYITKSQLNQGKNIKHKQAGNAGLLSHLLVQNQFCLRKPGSPNGSRTRVTRMRIWRPRPLDDGAF